jgi:hypothetical protein
MDSARLGRVLGIGARHAAKTLVKAVDAATAENRSKPIRPSAANTTAEQSGGLGSARPVDAQASRVVAQKAAKTVVQAREVKRGVARGSKRFGEAVWGPFVRLSGVLWLEVTGVFFGLFAMFALGTAWKLRGAWRTGAADHRQLLVAGGMGLLFSFLCVDGFVRARRREKRR